MKATLRDNIEWVGYVDWTVRNFHGYETDRGTTYNAYLVRDEKTVLIDTVKAPFAADLIRKISELTEPGEIDYLVCNHAEPDHSGALPAIVAACPRAEVVCNDKCRAALSRHFETSDWNFRIVADGESLSLGKRSLTFINTPMAHWPESMFTYVPEEKLLFSMDAFGQHYASSGRFDDEEPLDLVMYELKKYYANILTPYGKQVARAMERAGELDIETIAPSHGVIWRKNLGSLIEAYSGFAACKAKPKALVVYDTMWNSTEAMAQAILEGAQREGVETKLFNIRASSITTLATEILDAAAIAFGSPTLNRTMMPQMGALLIYLKGLRPTCKAGFAFGSYGWTKGGAVDVDAFLR
jgi:flavorubredoxin